MHHVKQKTGFSSWLLALLAMYVWFSQIQSHLVSKVLNVGLQYEFDSIIFKPLKLVDSSE